MQSSRRVVGSESDLLDSLSRDQKVNNFNNQWQSAARPKKIPPILKSHSDWGLAASMNDFQTNMQVRGRNEHSMMTKNLDEPVYSIPDLKVCNSHIFKPLSNSSSHYYSPTTPEPHEPFRVCLLTDFKYY